MDGNMCIHDFALFFDGKKFRWRCYKCRKFIEDIPKKELSDFDILYLS